MTPESTDDLRRRVGPIVKDKARSPARFWLEAGSAGVAGVLAVVTLLWRDWIELVFGVDPDGGNGSVEWFIVAALLGAALAFGGLAAIDLRRPARSS
jgi:hypothetical protein